MTKKEIRETTFLNPRLFRNENEKTGVFKKANFSVLARENDRYTPYGFAASRTDAEPRAQSPRFLATRIQRIEDDSLRSLRAARYFHAREPIRKRSVATRETLGANGGSRARVVQLGPERLRSQLRRGESRRGRREIPISSSKPRSLRDSPSDFRASRARPSADDATDRRSSDFFQRVRFCEFRFFKAALPRFVRRFERPGGSRDQSGAATASSAPGATPAQQYVRIPAAD